MTDEVVNEEEANDDFEAAFNEIAGTKDDPVEIAGEEPGDLDNPDPDPGDNPEPEPEDPYAGLDEATKARVIELEKENEKLNHRISSDSGRVSAFQRKINALEGQISQISKDAGGAQPSKQEITDAMGDDESWAQFQEDYPEVAAAIDSRLDKAMGAQNERINTTLAPVIEKQHEEHMESAYAAVAQEFPTWQDAVKEQYFGEWLNNQPAAIQQLADSDDPADASSLIGYYDDHRIAKSMPSLRNNDHDPDGGVVDDKAEKLAERRRQQLEDGVTVQSKPARVDPDAESGSDFENAFNAFAARKEAKRQA